jgi:NADPH:quinone reductase
MILARPKKCHFNAGSKEFKYVPSGSRPLGLVMVKRQQIIGSVLRSRPVSEKGEIVAEFTRRALPKFADRTIVPIIEKVFTLDQVAQAHKMMEEDKYFGKIVLKIAE